MEGARGGSDGDIYRHTQMHSGNAASVAIHPRDEQTHKASDSDEQGIGGTPHWAERKEERAAAVSLIKDHILRRQNYSLQ